MVDTTTTDRPAGRTEPRADKAAAVGELAEALRSSTAAVLTEYRGLTVGQLDALRTALGTGTRYQIVKNTLTAIAAREAGLDGLDPLLEGPTAVAFVSGDPVEAAKGLRDFAKDHPSLVIKGGVLDGAPVTVAEITRLADVEPREVLLAKMAGALAGGLSSAAALFQAPLAQAARLAQALVDAGGPSPSSSESVPPASEAPAPADEAPEAEVAAEVSA